MESEFNRPPRIIRQQPHEEVALPEAPRLPEPPRQRLVMVLAPLLSSLVYVVVMLFRGKNNLLTAIPMLAMSLIAAAMAIFSVWEQRKLTKRDRQAVNNAWTTALHTTDQQLQTLWQRQRTILHENDPSDLEAIITQPQARLWERRPHDADFLCIRLGIGDQPSSTVIKTQSKRETSPYELQLQRLIQRYASLPDVPLCLDLQRRNAVSIVGSHATSSLTNLIWQIVTHHSPTDVRLMMFWPQAQDRLWDWMRFLPHTVPPTGTPQYRWLGHSDLASTATIQCIKEAEQLFLDRQNGANLTPVVVLIIADQQPIPALQALLERQRADGSHCAVIGIQRNDEYTNVASTCTAYLNTNTQPSELALAGTDGGRSWVRLDERLKNPNQLARSLSQWHTSISNQQTIPQMVRLLDLLNIDDAATYNPASRWNTPPPTDDLHPSGLWPVPIGCFGSAPEAIATLNLNEKHEGVHGMIAGTTGSGKSELLTTLLIGLALCHHPDRLNFLLIDFKGGATFRDLAALPHTAGLVTDLAGNQAERALIAINSELDRRKQRLNAAGVPNIKNYRRNAHPEPIPNLLIVIDEFDEMARDYPDMIDELIRVAKQGRSLGVHLLFATQTPSNGAVKAGLRTNLTYWIALRVVDPEDSTLMIGARDAAQIPNNLPGRAYKRVGKAVQLFQSALVTSPYQPPTERQDEPFFLLDSLGRWQAPSERLRLLSHQTPLPNTLRSDADIVSERLCQALPTGYAAERYRIWQPPLDSQLVLSDITVPSSKPLSVVIGLADHPARAEHQPFQIDLATLGNIVVFGSSGAGKTSALRTMMLQLCHQTSPAEMHWYIIDGQGEALGLGATRLPHLADAVRISDGPRLDRLLALLEDEIITRQEHFKHIGVEHWQAAIEQHATSLPAIIVVIDPLPELVESHPTALPQISRLMRTSRSNGIFWLISSDRQAPQVFPADLRSSLGLKIVLRLSNENDSIELLNKPHAARLRQDEPGRGFISGPVRPQEIQVAYPTLRQPATIPINETGRHLDLLNTLEEIRTTSQQIAKCWEHIPTEQCGQPLRLLPTSIITPDKPAPTGRIVWLATENRTLAPFGIDFTTSPHWLIAGSPRSGKTTLLRAMLHGLTQQDCRLFVIDYRATLQALAKLPQTAAYALESGTGDNAFGSTFIDAFETAVTAARAAAIEGQPPTQRIVLAIANIDILEAADLNQLARWGKWAIQGRRIGLSCLVSGSDFAAFGGHGLIKALKQERTAAILGSTEISPTNLGLSSKALRWPTALDLSPGRGFLVVAGHEHVVQCWLPKPEQEERCV